MFLSYKLDHCERLSLGTLRSLFIALSILLAPALAHSTGTPPQACQAALAQDEFLRVPDDEDNGMVTNRIPMSLENTILAYSNGIFPWSFAKDGNAEWYNPPHRGILDFTKMHISKSDMKFIRNKSSEFEITYDRDFAGVIRACAEQIRPARDGGSTWITDKFIENYIALHRAGFAHSVEVWKNGELVGGLYGVFINGVFAGESMFHKVPDATKLALYSLVERLKSNGHKFIDTQMAAGLAMKWGAFEIPRAEFMPRLREAQSKNLDF